MTLDPMEGKSKMRMFQNKYHTKFQWSIKSMSEMQIDQTIDIITCGDNTS